MTKNCRFVDYRPDKHGQRLAELWNAAFDRYQVPSDHLQHLLGTSNGAHVVAVISEQGVEDKKTSIAGFATCFSTDNSIGFLSCVCVASGLQRQGIGSRLIGKAYERLRLRGCSNIHIGSIFPRFWCGVPTDLEPEIGDFLVRCGLKCKDVLAKDLCLELENYQPRKVHYLKQQEKACIFLRGLLSNIRNVCSVRRLISTTLDGLPHMRH